MKPYLPIVTCISLLMSLPASDAHAFCGMYVSGATASMYANATMVVLVRNGTRTVLSMQNNYEGPPESFAMVIPVPTILTERNVHTLAPEIFAQLDTLTAPRLVEYHEQDPCYVPSPHRRFDGGWFADAASFSRDAGAPPTVRIEEQFRVGEYEIVILSADDASDLETWLHTNNYNVPSGAESVLRTYVASGSKFFVAKVDPTRVTFRDGKTALSPLRFEYDSPDFTLPVRLGLVNSRGTQDLIVHILSTEGRYEAANYPNVFVPTNLVVTSSVRAAFASFYEGLFSEVNAANRGAVVTEYAWPASSCDPCPTSPPGLNQIATVGGLPNAAYTITRLHYRYAAEDLGNDLVFRLATPVEGGRGVPDPEGRLSQAVNATAAWAGDAFQARYVILNPWTRPITCSNPQRGTWGYGGSTGSASNVALTGNPPARSDARSQIVTPVPSLRIVGSTDTFERIARTSSPGVGGSARASRGASSCNATAVSPRVQIWQATALLMGFAALARRRFGRPQTVRVVDHRE